MSNVTFKHHQQVRDYGSVLANTNKQIELMDEESHELLRCGAEDTTTTTKSAPPLGIESAVAAGEESYGSSFQFGDSSSTNGSLKTAETATKKFSSYSIRDIAMNLSLYVNLAILAGKTVVYMRTMSLAVLASLLDSLLDVVSQLVLYYTERNSEQRSSDHYPAGAARYFFFFKLPRKQWNCLVSLYSINLFFVVVTVALIILLILHFTLH